MYSAVRFQCTDVFLQEKEKAAKSKKTQNEPALDADETPAPVETEPVPAVVEEEEAEEAGETAASSKNKKKK